MAPDPKAQYLQARQLWKDGKTREAETLYRRLISSYPAFPHPYYDLGVMREPLDAGEAASLYERFILLALSNSALYSLIIQAQERLSALKRAPQKPPKEAPSLKHPPEGVSALPAIPRNSGYTCGINFPNEYIAQRWAAGERISKLLYRNPHSPASSDIQVPSWLCVASFSEDRVQTIKTCADPVDQFTKWDDLGWAIEDLTYVQDKWVALLEKKIPNFKYGMSYNPQFPSENIQKGWDKGAYIHRIVYGGGRWIVLWRDGYDYQSQTYVTFNDNPIFSFDKLKPYQKDGFITDLSFCAGLWVLVISKGSQIREQYYISQEKNMPEDEIKQFWNDGYAITSVASGNLVWLLIMSK